MASAQGRGGKGFYLLIGAVVVAGGLLLLRAGGSDEAEDLVPVSVAGGAIEADVTSGVTLGSEDAPAVVYEFADYLCPHCRQFNALSGKLLRQNYAGPGGPLRWISFDFPLWPESWLPAIAAHCAGRQDKYWEMHDLLFARVDSWRNESSPDRKFIEYAKDLGLDDGSFRSCLDGQETLEEVRATRAYGESLGVNSTPTVFFNGERVTRGLDYGSLEERIQTVAGN